LSVSHVIYGLRVASNFPLPGVSFCSEPGAIDLQIWLKENKKFASKFSSPPSQVFYTSSHFNEAGETILRVGMLDDGKTIGFYYSDGARFAIERQGREIWADWPENYTLEDACTYLVGPVIAFALRLHGFTCLHASSIAVGGRAIALLGQPGAGKSTTAAAYARLGYSILADDVAVLDDHGDRFLVHPGYPRVNLWPDSVRALFGSEDALPHITPTWGKRYLPLDRNGNRFQATPLPLGAIYMLAEHEPGLTSPIVEEFAASEAFIALVGNTYVNYLLNADMRSREFDVLGRVVAKVPVRRVRTAADPSRLFDLCEAIVADAGQIGNRGAMTPMTKTG
jgi:hypothetical protein